MIVELLTVPAIILILGALLLPLIPERIRSSAFLLFPLAALGVLWSLPEGSLLQLPFASYELHLLQVDRLSRIFGTIFVMITFIGGVYAFHIKDVGQQSAAMAYAAGALGVTFAGDFFTLFFFWEIMAATSTYLIWARKTEASDKAGMRYILVHAFGGGLLLTGILLHLSSGGSFLIENIEETYTMASIFMLTGVALNSAIPPLHAWLADAYPKATITGAVFMSAFTTKSAVYVLIRLFPGWDILVYWGVAMALYGVVYAVLVNDIREILAYHIVSQVGYMVAGVGIGTEMAINGTTAHAFSHILYKSLLFMGAGAVIHATGKSKLTELGGFAKKMPVIVGLYMIGAFSISGFPFFNGFISKSMVVSAAGYAHFETVMLLLILASIGTFLHTGLKLPYFTWFGEKKSEFDVGKVPINMKIAMGFGAFFCTLFGVYPALLYNYLPYAVDYHPYTIYHFVEMMQILVFTFIGFWLLRKKLEGTPTIAIDTDWFYRKPAAAVRYLLVEVPNNLFGVAEKVALSAADKLSGLSKNPMQYLLPSFVHEGRTVKSDGFSAPMGAALAFILFGFLVASLVVLL
ncbi:Na(+)/H(+) antiporter subunit D [Gracilimonas mengyeensis]|uniref:Multisubunit sodium/proton antiporter, MrpD subunit n=1 Tax=Gracilimonas mengyeensis TaxID=1302730 RepID=A0A521ASY3_9BACT|nr:Na(+)/H(+) antiporter subunit D [Gracilimonas mengyeensis]SMO37917.1 multisubunit sodium/proton antiporter, MrpD subunit [Gracilimonas mengyeensis]